MFVRDSSRMRTKSLRIDSSVSCSTMRVPVAPPAKPVAMTGWPSVLSVRATLTPLPPGIVVCSTVRCRRPRRKFGTESDLSIAALSVTVMIMRRCGRSGGPRRRRRRLRSSTRFRLPISRAADGQEDPRAPGDRPGAVEHEAAGERRGRSRAAPGRRRARASAARPSRPGRAAGSGPRSRAGTPTIRVRTGSPRRDRPADGALGHEPDSRVPVRHGRGRRGTRCPGDHGAPGGSAAARSAGARASRRRGPRRTARPARRSRP